MSSEHFIIDTDPGIDDVMALLLACGAKDKFKIEGITLVFGNNDDMETLTRNACMVLRMAQQENVPVFKGCSKPLCRKYEGQRAKIIHSDNALGGLDVYEVLGLKSGDDKSLLLNSFPSHNNIHASQYIVDCCTTNARTSSPSRKISILTLGPLTNIATAIMLGGDTFVNSVHRIVMMGGTYDALGNKTACAEANIANDPESAKIVFNTFSNIIAVGLNLTRQIPLSKDFRLTMRKTNDVGKFCFQLTQHYVDLMEEWNCDPCMHDSVAVMYVLHPELFEFKSACVDVETCGQLTSGATIADYSGAYFINKQKQTHILTNINCSLEHFYQLYLYYIRQIPWKQTTNYPTTCENNASAKKSK